MLVLFTLCRYYAPMSTPAKSSAIACVLIDGDKIRQIRQNQGLTQLYVATSLGITTDTVSRWENKRSPSIKLENAEKLAEVLGVELADITTIAGSDLSSESALPGSGVESRSSPVTFRWMWWLPLLIFVLVAGGLLYKKSGGVVAIPVTVSAERLLPKHGSPYLPFPVLLRVHATEQTKTSFILRESFPESCIVTGGLPDFTAQAENGVKWISTTGSDDLYFGYLASSAGTAHTGEKLVFAGELLVDNKKRQVTGATTIEMLDYHWADGNNDYRIDDNEILTIYTSFELFKQMGVDIDKIQAIWAGHGYRFDPERKEFIVVNEATVGGE